MNGSDSSLDFTKFSFNAIVPVGALLHRLGNGVMTFLENHGVTEAELAFAALELTAMTSQPIDDNDRLTEYLYPRTTSLIEELEYNGRNVDYETFIMHYTKAVYTIYQFAFPYYRSILIEKGIENIRTPNITKMNWRFHGPDILIEIQVEDADK